MRTSGSDSQIAASLAVSALIIVLMLTASHGKTYSIDVNELLNRAADRGTVRVTGMYVQDDGPTGTALCNQTHCVPLQMPASVPDNVHSGRRILAMGQWNGQILDAREIITPCHETKP